MVKSMVDWGSALLVAVLGMVIVFIVLSLIMGVLIIMEKVFAPKKAVPKKEKEVTAVQVPAVKEVKKDDSELIAVLTAAVAACLGGNGVSSGKFKIKSYRKLGASSQWSSAARKENIYSRF